MKFITHLQATVGWLSELTYIFNATFFDKSLIDFLDRTDGVGCRSNILYVCVCVCDGNVCCF